MNVILMEHAVRFAEMPLVHLPVTVKKATNYSEIRGPAKPKVCFQLLYGTFSYFKTSPTPGILRLYIVL